MPGGSVAELALHRLDAGPFTDHQRRRRVAQVIQPQTLRQQSRAVLTVELGDGFVDHADRRLEAARHELRLPQRPATRRGEHQIIRAVRPIAQVGAQVISDRPRSSASKRSAPPGTTTSRSAATTSGCYRTPGGTSSACSNRRSLNCSPAVPLGVAMPWRKGNSGEELAQNCEIKVAVLARVSNLGAGEESGRAGKAPRRRSGSPIDTVGLRCSPVAPDHRSARTSRKQQTRPASSVLQSFAVVGEWGGL
jgi:hypothetical protein